MLNCAISSITIRHPSTSVEDPKFMYFLRNLLWSKFVRNVGFISVEFRSKYDFALSFAGEVRPIAEKLAAALNVTNWNFFTTRMMSIDCLEMTSKSI